MIIPFKLVRTFVPFHSPVRHKARLMSPIPPPPSAGGMIEWQADMFTTTALIPSIAVNQEHIGATRKFIEKFILKMFNLKPVQESSLPNRKLVLPNPELVRQFRVLEPVHSSLAQLHISQEHFMVKSYPLTVDNWSPREIMKAVLPLLSRKEF